MTVIKTMSLHGISFIPHKMFIVSYTALQTFQPSVIYLY